MQCLIILLSVRHTSGTKRGLNPIRGAALFFLPSSSRCLDILELSELEDLRKFHYHTLKLYCALCALGNTRVAHALCSHLDQSQLLYTIDNQYLSGMLREGFYNVLIRSVTGGRFPLTSSSETLLRNISPNQRI